MVGLVAPTQSTSMDFLDCVAVMRAGHVPLERIAPVVSRLIAERWPEGNGYSMLAEKIGCDESIVRRIADPPEDKDSVEFDVVDKILCALGPGVFAWLGELRDIYESVKFMETCALPSCNRKFRERFNGRTRKIYCSSRCSSLGNAVARGDATGERLRQKGMCLKGHKMTEANTIIKERNGSIERQCRTCKRSTQREWMRKKRSEEPGFREKKIEAQRRWRAKQA